MSNLLKISNGVKVTAVVAAAGKGKRMGKQEKLFISLHGKPLIACTLEALSNTSIINGIILVVRRINRERASREIVRRYRLKKVSQIVIGGATRTESVYKGLKEVDEETDFVLIHDGARPFIEEKIIDALVREAQCSGTAVVGVPVRSTIKRVRRGLIVDSTLDREKLWEIQTPQVFRRQLIKEAYHKAHLEGFRATDDSSLVERIGRRVKIVMGSYDNIKITTPEDLAVAEAILKNQKSKTKWSALV